jgi:hypothetical protein
MSVGRRRIFFADLDSFVTVFGILYTQGVYKRVAKVYEELLIDQQLTLTH